MVKCVKQFSGYDGCDKCDQRGSWDGRITYPETNNLTMRTDQLFRECWQPEHHQEEEISPFSVLPDRHDQIIPHRLYAPELSRGNEKAAALVDKRENRQMTQCYAGCTQIYSHI